MHRRSYLLIDLREIPCIHHITTYVDNLYGSVDLFGMYIPIFLSVLYFYKVLLLLAVTMGTVSYKYDASMKRSSRRKGLYQLYLRAVCLEFHESDT